MLTYQGCVDYVHGLEVFGSVLGLERMHEILHRLGDPHKKLRYIHIAGSNGKGSTTVMCTSVMRQAGYRCGMFISPYVVDFRERFQINGTWITEEDFAACANEVIPHAEQMKEEGMQITEFELITAIAFVYFLKKDCDLVCLEVGLGGNYDATNVITAPCVSVITSISLDHTHILGDTIAKIASEKAGIIKQNGICVCYPKQTEEAMVVLAERCANTNSRWILPNAGNVEIQSMDATGSCFTYGEESFRVSLVGEHQVYNAVTAIEAVRQLRRQGYQVSEEAIRLGLEQAAFPARFEVLSKDPLVVIDGAHNPDGAAALSAVLRQLPQSNKVMILGMLQDKDYRTCLSLLAKEASQIICVPVQHPRELSCLKLWEEAKVFCSEVQYAYEPKEAIRKALEAMREDSMLIVCGSLYMAGTYRTLLQEKLPELGR